MMFWKFQTHRPDATEPAPVFVPANPVAPQPQAAPPPEPPQAAPPPPPPPPLAPVAPQEQPAPPPPAPVFAAPAPAPAPAATPEPLTPQAPAGYEQAAERTMRFLADSLGIASWVLFKNQSGMLAVIAGIGDYQRYLPGREVAVGRLSDLQTINILGAQPPMTANGGVDRRQGGVDPATVAPFGVPLVDVDGNLFGLLCALGERGAATRAAQSRPLLDYAASMLGAVVRTELTLEEATRRTERAQADALVDPLTGLHNRRAWDQLLATEDQRCSRHGYDAVVFVIDLDGLKLTNDRFGHEKGDELIKNAATALERCVRRTDVVARVGGDEFAILAVKCDANAAARIREHIESTLLRANAPATVGFSVRSEAGDLFEAWRQADGAMYHRKRGNPRRGQRATDEPVQATVAEPQTQQPPQAEAQPAPQSQTPSPAQQPSQPVETSVVSQILERVLPALVTGIQKAAPPPTPPPPPPTPIFAPPPAPPIATRPLIVPGEAEIPTYTPPPAPIVAPPPPPIVAPEPPPVAVAPPVPVVEPAPEQIAPQLPERTPEPPAAPAAEVAGPPKPEAPTSQPSEDLIDIVSRLSRLSDADRRLLDVFFKGSR